MDPDRMTKILIIFLVYNMPIREVYVQYQVMSEGLDPQEHPGYSKFKHLYEFTPEGIPVAKPKVVEIFRQVIEERNLREKQVVKSA